MPYGWTGIGDAEPLVRSLRLYDPRGWFFGECRKEYPARSRPGEHGFLPGEQYWGPEVGREREAGVPGGNLQYSEPCELLNPGPYRLRGYRQCAGPASQRGSDQHHGFRNFAAGSVGAEAHFLGVKAAAEDFHNGSICHKPLAALFGRIFGSATTC